MKKGETGKEGRNGRGLQPFITAGPRGKIKQGVLSPQLTISHVVNYSVRTFCPPMMVDATPGE